MPKEKSVRVFFGGTFDPPHLGHHQMLLALLELPEVRCVHVVPTSINPLKDSAEATLYTADQRLKLCKAWLRPFQERVILENIELGAKTASYTQDSVCQLKSNHDGPWVLVTGADQLPGLDRWKGAPNLFLKDFLELWIFSRGDEVPDFNQVPLSLRQAFVVFRWLPFKIKSVSSTDLRKALRGHNALREIDLSLFAPGVFEVLANHP